MAASNTPATCPLVAIDGHNLLWRAAHGFPTRVHAPTTGQDLTTVFAFFALLRAALREAAGSAPAEGVVCFDGQRNATRRQQATPAYKATRAGQDLTPLQALPEVKQGLDACAIPWVELDDQEADDRIATLTTRAAGRW